MSILSEIYIIIDFYNAIPVVQSGQNSTCDLKENKVMVAHKYENYSLIKTACKILVSDLLNCCTTLK